MSLKYLVGFGERILFLLKFNPFLFALRNLLQRIGVLGLGNAPEDLPRLSQKVCL